MKIQVLSPELGLANPSSNHDFWVRKHTEQAIESMQHEVVPYNSEIEPDIQISFLGMPTGRKFIRPFGQFRAAWIYSRPEEYARQLDFLAQFDKVYGVTQRHSDRFQKETGCKLAVLPIGTNKVYKTYETQHIADIAYMGTANTQRCEPILKLASKGYSIVVAGRGWDQVKHKNIIFTRTFWPNEDFGLFFSKAPLSLYFTGHTFIEYGVVPIRIIDIYAAGDSLCVVNANPGLKETFLHEPPQFTSFEELVRHVDFYLKHPADRARKQKKIRQSVSRTYQTLVSDIIADAMSFWGSL